MPDSVCNPAGTGITRVVGAVEAAEATSRDYVRVGLGSVIVLVLLAAGMAGLALIVH